MTAATTASRPPRARYLLPLFLLIALVGVFFYSLFSGDPSQLPSALIGKPAPQFDIPPIEGFERNGGPGKGLRTADLATGEVTIVNVWASWCGPCIQEHPFLVWLKEQHGLRLVGINYKDAPDKALQFLERLGDPYDLIGADRTGRVAIDWGVYGVPETYVVDGRGEVVYRYVGPLSEKAVRDELLPAVEIARERTRSAANAL
jgi:cytochrome c biogenesis protein CcmG/thiol:disulfide interchange protein DsbE